MSETDDVLLDTEFAAYRELLVPAVQPAGPAVVRATVRRRRRRAVIATAVAVVLAAAIPVAANAALGRHSGPPSVPAETADPTGPPTPAPTAVSPTPTTASPAAADGRISREELLAARLDLPAWRTSLDPTCVTAGVLLRTPDTVDYVPVLLAGPEYGDVDTDGAAETVVVVGCRYGEALAKQVVVLDRDTAGRITTTGRVVDTSARIGDITDVAVDEDGAVRVRVANLQPCCGTSPDAVVRQWRTYTLTGGRFVQTAGPAAFPSRTPDAPASGTPPPGPGTIEAQILLYGARNDDGYRMASMAVQIGAGSAPIEYPLVTYPRNDRDEADVRLWEYCVKVIERPTTVTCVAEPLAAGESRWTLFPFRSTADGPDGQGTVRLDVGAGPDGTAVPSTGRTATFEVRFEG